jgi:hypothetical protein
MSKASVLINEFNTLFQQGRQAVSNEEEILLELIRKADQDGQRLVRIERVLRELLRAQLEIAEMASKDMQRLKDDMAKNTDAVASISALVTNLVQQIRDAADDPDAVRTLADQLESNNAALAAAAVAGTPAAPVSGTAPAPGSVQQ